MTERGVSEVLGYIYIFGIVMAVLALVFVQVNSLVEDTKKTILSQSLEQSFKKIQYTVYSVAFGETPSQILDIELQGGELKLKKPYPQLIIALVNSTKDTTVISCPTNFRAGCLNLTYGYTNFTSATCTGIFDYASCIYSINTSSMEYGYGTWRIGLEAGGVFSRYTDQGYSKLLSEPKIITFGLVGGTKTIVFTVPKVTGEVSAAGSGRFRFLIQENRTEFTIINVPSSKFNSTFNNPEGGLHVFVDHTEYARGWCKVFEKISDFNTTLSGDSCNSTSRCVCGDYATHAVFEPSRPSVGGTTLTLNMIIVVKEVEERTLG